MRASAGIFAARIPGLVLASTRSTNGSRGQTLFRASFVPFLGALTLTCLLALTWPGYDWFGNRIEPYVLGLPFSLAWVVGWVGLSFAALVAYHASGPPDGGEG